MQEAHLYAPTSRPWGHRIPSWWFREPCIPGHASGGRKRGCRNKASETLHDLNWSKRQHLCSSHAQPCSVILPFPFKRCLAPVYNREIQLDFSSLSFVLRLATTGNHWKCRFTFCEVLSKELSKKIVNIGWGVRATCGKKQSKSDCGDIVSK